MAETETFRNRVLAIIAIVLVIASLRASYAVTMPLAAAFVTIAAVWPVKPWLDRVLPSKISYLVTILFLLLITVGFIAAVYFSAAQVVRAFAQNQELFESGYSSLTSWTERWGIQDLGGREGYARLISFGQLLLTDAYTVFVYLGFIVILVMLGLPEVPAFRTKIRAALNASDRLEVSGTVDKIAGKIRQYLGITALCSAITGIASTLLAFAVGLELALVWGVLNFLLNFIPVIGNIVGILPPTLYAIIQFQDLTMPLIVFSGFALLQIVISNFVNPALQGRSLALSPFVIIVALAFWSWLWGIAGALIAVPLTATLVTICEHFSSTEWIARLLSTPQKPR